MITARSSPKIASMCRQHGFTLIEIAIVIVIIGLLLGGLLKGRELITSARVRNLITTQDGVRAVYFGFQDRYSALPGDYGAASANIPYCNGTPACQDGDDDGQILITTGGVVESISAWEHLSKAGFITGSYVYSGTPAATNTPANPYGGLLQFIYDNVYLDAAGNNAGSPRHNLKTGANIPSDILAEVDRKTDDGLGTGGQLRYSSFGDANTVAACIGAGNVWQSATSNPNCGGAWLF